MNIAAFPCRVSRSRAVTELSRGDTLLGVAQIRIFLGAASALCCSLRDCSSPWKGKKIKWNHLHSNSLWHQGKLSTVSRVNRNLLPIFGAFFRNFPCHSNYQRYLFLNKNCLPRRPHLLSAAKWKR